MNDNNSGTERLLRMTSTPATTTISNKSSSNMSLKRGMPGLPEGGGGPIVKLRRVATAVNVGSPEWFANGQVTSCPSPRPPTLSIQTPSSTTVVVPRVAKSNPLVVREDEDESDSDYSSSSYSSCDDVDGDDENDIESVWQSAFSQSDSVGSTATLTLAQGAQRQRMAQHHLLNLQRANYSSASTPVLSGSRQLQQKVTLVHPRSSRFRSLLIQQPPSETAIPKEAEVVAPPSDSPKPDEYLRKRLVDDGYVVQTFSSTEVAGFFHPLTEATVEGYDLDLVTKVRQEDVNGLRDLMKSGRTMQCSNQFGESIVHMACRRESRTVLEFLLVEAKVSCKLVCDSGRTPLHDACWTSIPNFAVIRMLLERCPDLLYITDKRGFTPMNYVRHSNWKSWCDFLGAYDTEKLAAKELWTKATPDAKATKT